MDLSDYQQLDLASRLGVIVAAVVIAHLAVITIRAASRRVLATKFNRRYSKAWTITTLTSSVAMFLLYFAALGFTLNELGVSVTAYVASASIIGLAVAFGSQGIVQDVVMGVTILLSDLFDVGDMVEIGGQTGIVRSIGNAIYSPRKRLWVRSLYSKQVDRQRSELRPRIHPLPCRCHAFGR